MGNFEEVGVERGRFTLFKVLSINEIYSYILHLNISNSRNSNFNCVLFMVQDPIRSMQNILWNFLKVYIYSFII